MKRIVGLGIVLFWVVMVGLLIRRSLPESSPFPPPVVPLNIAEADAQSAEWMGIYHQEQKVGYLRRHLIPMEQGYQWHEQWRMHLQVLGTSQTLHTEVHARTDRHYTLNDFSFRTQSAGVAFRVTGAVVASEETKGAAAPYELRGHVTTGGETSAFTFPLREPLYLPGMTQLVLRHATLRPGDERQFRIFNHLSMRPDIISMTTIGPETLSLHGETLTATKVAGRFAGTTVHVWLDQDGRVVKEEARLGLVLVRESREEALRGGWQTHQSLDLVAATAIPVRPPLPYPRQLSQLRLKLSGLPEATAFTFLPRQQQEDDVLVVQREEVAGLTTYQLPQTRPEFIDDLAATPFIQSAHPRLIAQARTILGRERDALTAVHRLLDWTYTSLKKIPTVGMPTALEALHSKQGDCNEHAVLFTALARASGLPARVAAGVVYLDEAFYYHAWSEVWLGQWIAVDPVLGQFPADATHVKFVSGGPEHHFDLLQIIGQLGLEVVEYH